MKGLIGLSLILLSLSTTSKPSPSIKKSNDVILSSICLGTAIKDNIKSKQLIDEYQFEYSSGSIIYNSKNYSYPLFVVSDVELTLAIGFDDVNYSKLTYFSHNIDLLIKGNKFLTTLSFFNYQYSRVDSVNNGVIKSIGLKEKAICITFSLKEDDVLNEFIFTYASTDIPFSRVQLFRGSYYSFEGFSKALAPCSLSEELSRNDYYFEIDVNRQKKEDFIKALKNNIIGYDEKEDEYLKPSIIYDQLDEDYEFNKYARIVLRIINDERYKDLNIYVKYVDNLPPIINKINSGKIRIPYHQFKKEDLLNYFEVIDAAPLSNEVIGLSSNELGTKTYTFIAYDKARNKSELEFEVEIYDDLPPFLSFPSLICINTNKELDVDKIKALVKAKDEIDDEDISLTIDDSIYKENMNTPGSYSIKVKAKDKSANEVERDIKLLISDDENMSFYIYGSEITAFSGSTVDILRSLNTLGEQGTIPNLNYVSYSVTSGEDPSITPLTLGTHKVSVVAIDDNGVSSLVNLTIKVVEEDLFKTKEKKTFLEQIIDFFKNIINIIVSFFSNLFK